MTAMRGPSSRIALDIDWTYPKYVPEAKQSTGDSISVEIKHALELEQAFGVIAGDDPRPLLVLRECLTCTGTDDALLTKGADNEKTMLMSRWFHCVKLPPAVLEADDPFHKLFAEDGPAHLFVAKADGSGRLDLNGEQSRTELWAKMEKLLEAEYKTKHEPVLKKLFGVLDEMDGYDQKIADLDGRMNDAIEKDGPKSRKVAKIKKELTKLRAKRNALVARLGEISELALRADDGEQHARAVDSSDESA